MSLRVCLFALFAVSAISSSPAGAGQSPGSAPPNAADSARAILQRYADAWRGREELELPRDLVVGLWIRGDRGGDYHVVLSQTPKAAIQDGVPAQFDLGFEMDIDFLRRLDRGEINALTGMGQARSTDPTPMVPKPGPQFASIPNPQLLFRRLPFHFWTRDWPEVVRFGEGTTREIHGANATAFVYDNGLRTAWYQIKAGMHINRDPALQKNTYPQMLVVTRGRFHARWDGQVRVVSEGEMILILPGMAGELWAEADEYGEFVWIGYGPGA